MSVEQAGCRFRRPRGSSRTSATTSTAQDGAAGPIRARRRTACSLPTRSTTRASTTARGWPRPSRRPGATQDQDARAEAFSEVIRLSQEDALILPLLHQPDITAVYGDIGGFVPEPLWQGRCVVPVARILMSARHAPDSNGFVTLSTRVGTIASATRSWRSADVGWEPELEELRRRHELAEQLGGPEGVARQRALGKLTVLERLDRLADRRPFAASAGCGAPPPTTTRELGVGASARPDRGPLPG